MSNTPIDVPLPDNVKQFLATPQCLDIQFPPPEKLQVCLPFGGKIQGIVDATKTIPDDCSLSFSILLQLPPLMASLGCFIKILKLVKPLMDVIQAVGNPTKLPAAIPAFIQAAEDVLGCVLQIPLGVPQFVRDLLLLIAKFLTCLSQSLKSIANLMGGLQLSIATAQQNNNTELLAQLQCAQQSAQNQAAGMMGQMDVIATILELAEPLFGIAGVPSITIPTGVSASDVQAISTTADTMLEIAQIMTEAAQALKALPEC